MKRVTVRLMALLITTPVPWNRLFTRCSQRGIGWRYVLIYLHTQPGLMQSGLRASRHMCSLPLCRWRSSPRERPCVRHLPRNSRLLHPGGSPLKALPQVTQFDAFLTSDPTEAQITEWVKAICHTLAEVQTNKQTTSSTWFVRFSTDLTWKPPATSFWRQKSQR